MRYRILAIALVVLVIAGACWGLTIKNYFERGTNDVELGGNVNVNSGGVFTLKTGGALNITAVNAAGASANPIDFTGTLGIMDGTGSDDFCLIDVNLTNADHTGGTVEVIDIANITGDANATETAIKVGTGWDVGVQSASGLTVTGAIANLNASSNYAVNIGTGTSTGDITLGGAAAQTIAIGTGAAAKAVSLGSSNTTSSTAIAGGTGDVSITSADDLTLNGGSSGSIITVGGNTHGNVINVGADDTTADTITVGSAKDTSALAGIAVTVGSTGTTSATTIQSGTGDVNITSADDLNVGANASATDITVGNETGASSLKLYAGTGNITMDGVAATTITIGDAAQTGTVKVGESSAAMQLDLGTGTGAHTINIGNGAGAQTVALGSTNTTSTTTINAGSGGIQLYGPVNFCASAGTPATTAGILGGAGNTNQAGAYSIGTSGKGLSFYLKSTSTTATDAVEGLYVRTYYGVDATSVAPMGEAGRFFASIVGDAAGGTITGCHMSAGLSTGATNTGLTVGSRSTLSLPDGSVAGPGGGGTFSGALVELYTGGASSTLADVTSASILQLAISGTAPTAAAQLTIPVIDVVLPANLVGNDLVVDDTASDATVGAKLRIKVNGVTYWVMLADAAN